MNNGNIVAVTLLKKRDPGTCVFYEFCKNFKSTHCTEHLCAIILTEVMSQGVFKKIFSEYYESFP